MMIRMVKEYTLYKRFVSFKQIVESNKVYTILFMFICFFAILFVRRGAQLLTPEVWDEDGTYNLITYIQSGWMFIFEPVNGYFITISKLITGISASISILYYPEISTYLTWIFQISVCIAIALSPTHLNNKFLCALAVLLVPSNPEVLGIPLYSFWFTSLLLFLVILWKAEKYNWVVILFVIIGGLSSPIIAILPVFLAFRMAFQPNYRNGKVALLLLVSALITLLQVYFILKIGAQQGRISLDFSLFYQLMKKFFGFYYSGFVDYGRSAFWAGIGIVLYLIFNLYYQSIKTKSNTFLILILLLSASILLSINRIDYIAIDPYVAGPRYFFFPYILISWSLIYTLNSKVKPYSTFFLVLSLVTLYGCLTRSHDDLEWRSELLKCSCEKEGIYSIPVHFNGNEQEKWSMNLTSVECSNIVEKDIFKTILKTDCQ